MQSGAVTGSVETLRTDCIVVGVYAGGKLTRSAMALVQASGHAMRSALERGDHEGAIGTTLLLREVPGVAAERVLLVGLGRESDLSESRYAKAIASAVQRLCDTGAVDATFCLGEIAVRDRDAGWKAEQAVLGVMDGVYRFERLKSAPPPQRITLERLSIHVANPAEIAGTQAAISRAHAIGEGIALAKDLGNLPGNVCTPTYLARQAQELGTRHGFKVEILDQADMERLGMGALAAIARGSREPAKLIVMEHGGASRDARPIVLVGKGITFDAGGISIKSARDLDEMKFDMCGAASVFGAMHAAALMGLPIFIVGIVPSTENMPGGNAVKPGDVVTTLSGQTVEILDTDAEGRVVLCDALTYAEKYKPAAVVDIATLTGAIVTALGHVAHGVFSRDDDLAREMLEAGDSAWDRAWRMPLWEDYEEALDSNFADFANVGPDAGDAIIAACFLSRFTTHYPWVHLDVAGTASRSGTRKGATGRPVALLAHFLSRRARAAATPV